MVHREWLAKQSQTVRLLVLPFSLAARSFLEVSPPFLQRCWAGLCRGRATGKGRGVLGARQDSDSARSGTTFLQKQLKGKEEAIPVTFYKHQQGSVKVFSVRFKNSYFMLTMVICN